MDIKKLLGKRIKELRKEKNLTQEKLSELIGIETVSLSNIETGKYYPTAENLNKILSVLNIAPSVLFAFEHFESDEYLLREINKMLKEKPEKIKESYKILRAFLN